RDQVTITENVKFGDVSATAGLEVLARTHYNHHLYWDTSYQTDKKSAQTNYQFFHNQAYNNPPIPMERFGVQMQNGIEYGFHFTQQEEQLGIAAAYKELFDRTPTGTEGSTTIRLKDYYDFYPLLVTLTMPGNILVWESDLYIDPAPEPGTEEYIIETFRNFFRIPVLEDETVEISITKNADGSMNSSGSGSTDSDAFYIWTLSALTDDTCYFTFNPHTNNGNVVDTSLIPGGYGIYCLPYSQDRIVKDGMNISGILIDELSMVYSLNPEDRVFDLYVNPDQTKLLLLTEENNICVLTVIDMETMKPLQRLELADLGEEDSVWNTYYYDDFFALYLSGNQLAVVDINEDKEYEHQFTVNLTDEAEEGYFPRISAVAVMDWDGKNLVVSDFLSNSYRWSNMDSPRYCSFYLAVYDESGLLYYGEYLSSLDAGNDLNNYANSCRSIDYSPLSVKWTD
ncbi:MAG: hypothetical protein GX783_04875, partial [Clostridiales bacterium]|nr:hypothetical protein [Clostridiales bacterium]